MGFFSKHKKEEDKTSLPPSPKDGDSSLPPPPSAPTQSSNELSVPPIPNLDSGSTLTPPPIPGGSFDDIKNQVVNESPGFREDTSPKAPESFESPNNSQSSDESNFDFEDDSLFDLGDIENSKNEVVDSNLSNNVSNLKNQVEPPKREDTTVDTNLDRKESFNFISNRNASAKGGPQGSFFVTTQQFKDMLDIIDSVKGRVKDASDTHLRLLDIKSEEDIEYENLRKDFQYIEDKLYELDSLVFEK